MEHGELPSADKVVRLYIAQLGIELEGADAALRHDAIIDAEQHLRAAIGNGATAEMAVSEYGSPTEIARAYMDAEHLPRAWHIIPATTAISNGSARAPVDIPAVSQRQRLRDIPIIGVWFDRRAWGAVVYFGAVGFVLSLAYFVWSVTIGSLAIGLAPILIGIPIVVLLLGSARAICLFEGKVVEFFLGVRMPRRTQPVQGADRIGFWQRIWCWLRDVRSWLSLGFLLGNFPVSVVTFAVTFTLAVTSLALVVIPVVHLLGHPIANVSGDDADINIMFMGTQLVPDAAGDVWLTAPLAVASLAIGLALATGTLWLARGFGWVYGHVVQAIQVARPQPMNPPKIH